MAGDVPIMQEALELMKSGKMPDAVSRSLTWAALTHIYAEVSKLNGRVMRVEIVIALIGGAVLVKIGEWLINLF